MTANLPSWCLKIDEIIERVAKRRGLEPEEVRLLAINGRDITEKKRMPESLNVHRKNP